MPVKIRLMRIGAKKRPFYRVVAVDERKKRTGDYLELLGTYNPLTEPKEVILKKDRIEYWTKQGAVPSEGYLRAIGKAPQHPARKPRKAKETKEETPVASPQVAEAADKATVEPEEKTEKAPEENIQTAPESAEQTTDEPANQPTES